MIPGALRGGIETVSAGRDDAARGLSRWPRVACRGGRAGLSRWPRGAWRGGPARAFPARQSRDARL